MTLNATINQTAHTCSQALAVDGLLWHFTQPHLVEYQGWNTS